MSKTLIILSSVSGGGKSTFAEFLWRKDPLNSVICSADNYFIDNQGNYNFDSSQLGKAHQFSKNLCKDAMKANAGTVIVDNTNTTRREAKEYIDMAEQFEYAVTWLVVLPAHDGHNQHMVPQETLQKQVKRLNNTVGLINQEFIEKNND